MDCDVKHEQSFEINFVFYFERFSTPHQKNPANILRQRSELENFRSKTYDYDEHMITEKWLRLKELIPT